MKILIVNQFYPPVAFGGYELSCAATVSVLSRQHDVYVLTSSVGEPSVGTASGNQVEQVIRKLPHREYFSPWQSRHAFRDTSIATRVTRDVIDDIKPDLINVWQMCGMPQATLSVILSTDCPVILTIEDYWPLGLNSWDPYMKALSGATPKPIVWAVRAHNALSRGPTLKLHRDRPVGAIWVSEFVRRSMSLQPTMIATDEQVILPPSPGYETFSAAEARDRSRHSTSLKILFAGRIVREKGPYFLLECAQSLQERLGPIEFRFAGTIVNTDMHEFAELAETVLSPSCVSLLGMLSPEQLAREFTAADVFVMPSLWDEPSGLTLLDAAAARVPIVAAASGGMTEILRPDVDALFFKTGDHAEMVDAIEKVVQDPEGQARRTKSASLRAQSMGHEYYRDYIAFVDAYLSRHGSEKSEAGIRHPTRTRTRHGQNS